jgi:hypothetical protein
MLKKVKASHGTIDFVPMLLVIILGAYLLINCGLQLKYLDTVNKLENISQKYLLRISTTKGLTADDMRLFFDEMQDLGITRSDINLAGTTFYDENIKYGDAVYFKADVKIPYYNSSINDNLERHEAYIKKNVSIDKCAVALV